MKGAAGKHDVGAGTPLPPGVELRREAAPVAYEDAVRQMEARVDALLAGTAPELLWLLEHPPLYTEGTSAVPQERLGPLPYPVHATGRGGRITWHGPGQRVAYVVADLRRRGQDLRAHIRRLEAWGQAALAECGVAAEPRADRVGLWVVRPDGQEEKIGAIGVRVRRWVAFHGIALNVDPDLSAFAAIVPCGLKEYGVTSLRALGSPARMEDLDAALLRHAATLFPD